MVTWVNAVSPLAGSQFARTRDRIFEHQHIFRRDVGFQQWVCTENRRHCLLDGGALPLSDMETPLDKHGQLRGDVVARYGIEQGFHALTMHQGRWLDSGVGQVTDNFPNGPTPLIVKPFAVIVRPPHARHKMRHGEMKR